jgi:CHAT domain-containing protein/Tfp pilus assembly protein PilF
MTPTKALAPLLKAQRSLDRLSTDRDSIEIQTLTLLGYVYSYLDSTGMAVRSLEHALQLQYASHEQSSPRVSGLLYTLGLAMKKKGYYDEALTRFEEARRLQVSARDTLAEANSLLMIGTIQLAEDEYANAMRSLLAADSLLDKLFRVPTETQASCSFYSGMAYYAIGAFSAADREFQKALSLHLSLSTGENPAIASIYVKLGDVYNATGDVDRALNYYHRAISTSVKVFGQGHSGIGEIYQRMGDVYSDKGEARLAISYAMKGVKVRQSALGSHHPEISLDFENIGDVCVRFGNYRQALPNYRKSISVLRENSSAGHLQTLGRLQAKLGKAFLALGEADSAEQYLSRALPILTDGEVFNRRDLAIAQKWNGDLEMTRRLPALAVTWYDRALATLQVDSLKLTANTDTLIASGLATDLINILGAKAVGLGDMNGFDSSFATFMAAWQLLDSLRRQFSSEGSRLRLGEVERPLFDDAIEMCLSIPKSARPPSWDEAIFEASERGRANVLNDALDEARISRIAGIPDEKIVRLRELKARLTFCQEQRDLRTSRRESNDSTRVAFYQVECFNVHRELIHLTDSLSSEYPNYAALMLSTPRLRLATFQANLDERTCVLDYQITSGFISVFAITRHSARVFSQVKPPKFDDTVISYRRALRLMNQKECIELGSILSKILLGPIHVLPSAIDRLVILPDGSLFYLPFEALPLAPTNRPNKGILLDRYKVLYSHSALSFAQDEDSDGRLQANASFLGLAPFCPDIPSDHLMRVRPPSRDSSRSFLQRIALREVVRQVYMLPYSRREVEAVARLFVHHGLAATVFLGKEASIGTFDSTASKYSVVHLATHTEIDSKNPSLSGILFNSGSNGSERKPEKLLAGGLYRLNYSADLVVLSSCESGLGELIGGEGIMGLTRGFFYGGAKHVLVSLWKVPDRAASDFMQMFYKYAISGQVFDQALRSAKLEMCIKAGTEAPRYWAAFVLITK